MYDKDAIPQLKCRDIKSPLHAVHGLCLPVRSLS